MASRHGAAAVRSPTHRVREALSAAPRALPSDPDQRARLLKRKLRTGHPVRTAEVVRDLAWRQRTGQANRRDVRQLWRADRELVRWLAGQSGQERRRARQRMWGTVERTISRFA